MISQAEATIYLASQRGCSQTAQHRSYHTFNFGAYFNEHRKPFGNLKVFNDETLKGGSHIKWPVSDDTVIMLLPVVGGLNYKNGHAAQGYLEAGQTRLFKVPAGAELEISNPYKQELINYLLIRLKSGPQQDDKYARAFDLDLTGHKNHLIPLFSDLENDRDVPGYIGKFKGREEGICRVKDPAKGIFAVAIEGVFEVQNRLLQPRDGLALWGVEEIGFEALSSEAIILLLDPVDG